MLGAMIGDIAGSRFEFNNIKTKAFTLFAKDCFFTDDTVMTVAVARALLQTAAKRAAKPVVLRASDVRSLGERAQRFFSLECAVSDVHALLRPTRGACGEEMTEPILHV